MDKHFLMGNRDGLVRSNSGAEQTTFVTPGLRNNLTLVAIRKACEFYVDFFDQADLQLDYARLVAEYEQVFSRALALGLFEEGGIREKDHVNLWCLGRVLAPEVYVESGVFIGSSLHAFIESATLKKAIAIDPNLDKLRVPKEDIPEAELIDDQDFSQLDIDLSGKLALVYFDDHIDTASRILQASEKGFRYALFDDSTGLEGVCQRLYPAVPTIPMIMHAELLSLGDELSWSFKRSSTGIRGMLKRIMPGNRNAGGVRVTLTFTQSLMDKCFAAKKLIKKCEMIPDLGEFIPHSHPATTVDTSKYLVELNQD